MLMTSLCVLVEAAGLMVIDRVCGVTFGQISAIGNALESDRLCKNVEHVERRCQVLQVHVIFLHVQHKVVSAALTSTTRKQPPQRQPV
jgi:DNA-binding FrmR family transcriptional regulator